MSTSFDLSGRLALVTGASSGLGNRFAQVLANNGARVVLASRRVERLKELRAEIEANAGTAHVIGLDGDSYRTRAHRDTINQQTK